MTQQLRAICARNETEGKDNEDEEQKQTRKAKTNTTTTKTKTRNKEDSAEDNEANETKGRRQQNAQGDRGK